MAFKVLVCLPSICEFVTAELQYYEWSLQSPTRTSESQLPLLYKGTLLCQWQALGKMDTTNVLHNLWVQKCISRIAFWCFSQDPVQVKVQTQAKSGSRLCFNIRNVSFPRFTSAFFCFILNTPETAEPAICSTSQRWFKARQVYWYWHLMICWYRKQNINH